MQKCIENLEKNGFSVVVVENAKEALEYAKTRIVDGLSIGLGGSTTVAQIGLLEYLASLKNITLYNQYEKGIDKDENIKRRRMGLISDLYITGSNAITEDGELVNVDGSGNRVAAQIFGPKSVLLFVGQNKIVKDFEAAKKRLWDIAIPKNAERSNKVATTHKKERHFTPENISNKFSYINHDDEGRTTIVLIKEDLGF
ncbi:MAG: LUD domain-containing protein [Campylobacteraceae bacterium]|nr:LUD domain-containing protein [Campylobacteraceae bacterium]